MRGRPPKYDWNILEPKIKEMLQSNMTHKEISEKLGIPYFSLMALMSQKGITRINVVGCIYNPPEPVSKTYSMVNCLMRKIRKNKEEVNEAIAEVCAYYNVEPNELCEICNDEIDEVVKCYTEQRTYKKTAKKLMARYGIKPCIYFICNALYFSGCQKISVTPDLPQPPSAIHVEDPDGVYPGFWLTPEQALTLAEIRVTKRMTGRMANDLKTTLGILQDERGKCLRQQ